MANVGIWRIRSSGERKSMRKVLGGLIIGTMLTGATAVDAASCQNDAERTAFHVRSLQTELMVAALTCGNRDDYNEFAIKFKKPLVEQGHHLKRGFRASYGAGAERELNAYVTALANRLSARSVTARDAFCKRAERTFQALASMPSLKLAAFSVARPAGDVDVPSSCRPTVELVGTPR